MTTFTTNFAWPVPSGTDQPDGAAEFSALATPIDATVFAGIPYLARQTLGGSAASVTFSSIPSTLRNLRIRHTARSDGATNIGGVSIRINGDSGANYNYTVLSGLSNGTPTTSPSATQIQGSAGVCVGANGPAGAYGVGVVEIVGWDNPHTGFLQWTWLSSALGTGTANFMQHSGGGQYIGTFAARTSVTILADSGTNFVAGSDFTIEGVRT